MNRVVFLGMMIYAILVAALLTLRGELLILIIPLGLYLLVGFWRSPGNLDLEATRSLSTDRALPGAPVDVTVTIHNRGSDLDEVVLEDVVPSGLTVCSGSSRMLLSLAAGESHVMRYAVKGPRGGYTFDEIKTRANEGFDLSARATRLAVSSEFLVFPAITRLRHIVIRPRRTRVYAGSIPARAGGSGIEFFGVRSYRPGDSSRSINWRLSARHPDEMYSNEFQQERVSDVGIVLDGRLRTNALGQGHTLFEYSVQAAASVADAFLFQGNRVGLLLYADYLGWTLPAYGRVQRERILQALARARLGDSQVFSAMEHLPIQLFPPESQIVVISPLTGDDILPLRQLRALGYQVMVISPDPVSLEIAILRRTPSVEIASRIISMERALVFQRLRRAGIQILNWNISQPLDLEVQKHLGHPPGWLQAIGS